MDSDAGYVNYTSMFRLSDDQPKVRKDDASDFLVLSISNKSSSIKFFIDDAKYDVSKIDSSLIYEIGNKISLLDIFPSDFKYKLDIRLTRNLFLISEGRTDVGNPAFEFYYPMASGWKVEDVIPSSFKFIFHELLHAYLMKQKVELTYVENEYLVHKTMMCIAEITDKQIFEVQYPNYPADLKKEVLLNKIAELKPTQKGFMLAAYDLYNLNDKASTLESCTQVTDYFGEDFFNSKQKDKFVETPERSAELQRARQVVTETP